jgi:Rieske 2Fe-2S family protein
MNAEDAVVSAQEMKPALEARFYSSPDVFRIETQRLFHGQWFCVGRADQLPASGDCLHVSVLGESIVVLRGRDDALRAFYNVCRHRGSRLLRTPPLPDPAAPGATNSGRIPAGVVCPYHAWTYNLDGTLRAAPFVRFDATCPKEQFSLVPVQLDTWGGFVFVNLAEIPATPLGEQLDGPVRRLVRYPLADLRRGAQIVYDVKANWKIIMENYNECYHCGPVHPELCRLVPSFAGGGDDLDWEAGIPHREDAWTFTTTGTTSRAPLPGLDAEERTRHKGDLVYPNLMVSASADHVAAFVLLPHAPNRTTVECSLLFAKDAAEAADFDPSDAGDLWDLVNRQDWAICESVQRGMSSRSYRHGWFAPMEDDSLDIRRWLLPRLGQAGGGGAP